MELCFAPNSTSPPGVDQFDETPHHEHSTTDLHPASNIELPLTYTPLPANISEDEINSVLTMTGIKGRITHWLASGWPWRLTNLYTCWGTGLIELTAIMGVLFSPRMTTSGSVLVLTGV